MSLSSVAAIAFSAMQAQSNNLSVTAEAIANAGTASHEAPSDAQTGFEGVDLAARMTELAEQELAYRTSAAAFETGADLWDILNVVTRD